MTSKKPYLFKIRGNWRCAMKEEIIVGVGPTPKKAHTNFLLKMRYTKIPVRVGYKDRYK